MAEETKFPFRMYSVSGEGLINSGYHPASMEIIEVVDGSVSVQIGTETVEASRGELLLVPSGLVFRATASEGSATLRAMVFDSSIIEQNMDNFDTDIFYMFYVQSRNKITVFGKEHPVYSTLISATRFGSLPKARVTISVFCQL